VDQQESGKHDIKKEMIGGFRFSFDFDTVGVGRRILSSE
jgi:hypothetical protein